MATNNTEINPFLFMPQNENELALLKYYNNYLIEQVEQMELHATHKQDVQKMLTKVITKITGNNIQYVKAAPGNVFARMSRRIFG